MENLTIFTVGKLIKIMTDKLQEVKNKLLGNTYIQKGSRFKNKVILVSLISINSDEIRITYITLNNDSDNSPSMEYNQFINLHII